jgi:hypothetical protein
VAVGARASPLQLVFHAKDRLRGRIGTTHRRSPHDSTLKDMNSELPAINAPIPGAQAASRPQARRGRATRGAWTPTKHRDKIPRRRHLPHSDPQSRTGRSKPFCVGPRIQLTAFSFTAFDRLHVSGRDSTSLSGRGMPHSARDAPSTDTKRR